MSDEKEIIGGESINWVLWLILAIALIFIVIGILRLTGVVRL